MKSGWTKPLPHYQAIEKGLRQFRYLLDIHQQTQLFLLINALLVINLATIVPALIGLQSVQQMDKLSFWTKASLAALIAISLLGLGQWWQSRQKEPRGQFRKLYAEERYYLQGLLAAIASALIWATGLLILDLSHVLQNERSGLPWSLTLYLGITVIVHVTGLICLTYRLVNMILLLLLSFMPILYLQFTSAYPGLFIQIMDIYLGFMLMGSYWMADFRARALRYAQRNDRLVAELTLITEQNSQSYQKLAQLLAEKVSATDALAQANAKLKELNEELEQRVASRTELVRRRNHELRIANERMKMATDMVGIGTWDWDLKARKVIFADLEPVLGYTTSEGAAFLGNINKIIHPEDYPLARHALIEHLRSNTEFYSAEFRIKNREGQWIWMKDLGRVVERNDSQALRMVGVRRSLANDKLLSNRLKMAEQIFEQAQQGLFMLDAALYYLNVNPYLCDLLGLERTELIGHQLFSHSGVMDNIQRQHKQLVQSVKQHGYFRGEITTQHRSGNIINLLVIITPMQEVQHEHHFVGVVTDLTRQKRADVQLEYLSNYDRLTDLPNRHLFKTYLLQLLKRSHASGFALIRLNIDRFRLINDSLGVDTADQLLKYVAEKLQGIKQQDEGVAFISRLGVDDFAIILRNELASRKAVEAYCQRLLAVFEQPITLSDQRLSITISLGVALYPEHGQQMDILVNSADKALHQLKRVGGNGLQFYSHEGGLQTLERIQLESALRQALTNDELVIYYQPKVSVSDGQLIGFEALVRWLHPHSGLISPVHFIPLAEETGLLSVLGEIVLEKSCQQLADWAYAGLHTHLAVNVGVQQLQRGSFQTLLSRILARHQIDPATLQLEITESSLMDEPDKLLTMLNDIRQRGVTIALDDFGTGYSSLSYLAHYPIDVLKIDRTFVSQLGLNSQDAIVRAIIAMGHSLNMQVVAEGVETQAQAQFLKAEHCDVIQGYLIGKPVPADQATELLKQACQLQQPLIKVDA